MDCFVEAWIGKAWQGFKNEIFYFDFAFTFFYHLVLGIDHVYRMDAE